MSSRSSQPNILVFIPYDLEGHFYPLEANNLVAAPAYAAILTDLQQQMHTMMVRSDSPLLRGHVSPSLSSTANQVVKASQG